MHFTSLTYKNLLVDHILLMVERIPKIASQHSNLLVIYLNTNLSEDGTDFKYVIKVPGQLVIRYMDNSAGSDPTKWAL